MAKRKMARKKMIRAWAVIDVGNAIVYVGETKEEARQYQDRAFDERVIELREYRRPARVTR